MPKQGALGCALYVAGYDLGSGVQSFRIAGGPVPIDVTDITQSAHARIGGRRDGSIDCTDYLDPATVAGGDGYNGAHSVLSLLPTADTLDTVSIGTTIGAPAACLNAKQIGYDPNRPADGSLTIGVNSQGNSYGLEWGVLLTPGTRTDVAATNGTSWDTGASADYGVQAYLHVVAFTGTDATVKIQDSADNNTFADVAGLAFTQTTTAPGWQRIAIANTATVRRYVRAVTVTTGGFTSLSFVVVLVKNECAGVVF